MLARVTRFEGGTPEGIRAAIGQLRSDLAKGPPEGIKSNGLTAGKRSSVDIYEVGAEVRT